MAKWICKVHGEGFTAEVPCQSEQEAEQLAVEYVSRAVRVGKRVYPSEKVIFCEIEEKE